MSTPLAVVNGQLVPAEHLSVPVDDAGFLMGVTVPEQLRTFAGKVFRLEQHLDRLERGLAIVGVPLPASRERLVQLALELVAYNHALLPPGHDLGLTLFVTPGPLSPQSGRGPLWMMHTRPLPFATWAHLYDQGQNLVTTPVEQVPTTCWLAELKCRSRMHYWLADRAAQAIEPGARALLLDQEGYVTEASTANLLVYYRNRGLISPPPERILPGISVATLAELATELGIPFSQQLFTPAAVAAADEVLLCSTSPCVWPVLKFEGQAIGTGKPGECWQRLIQAWSGRVGVDIVGQARQFAG